MTEFRVLPVRRGDAFLLHAARGTYLVDGGVDGCDLPEILRDREVKRLRAAICTAPCRERLGGLLDLLESDIDMGEIWLPENIELLIESARRFDGDWEGWLRLLQHGKELKYDLPDDWIIPPEGSVDNVRRHLEGAAFLIGLGLTACLGKSPYAGVSRETFVAGDQADSRAGLVRFFQWSLETFADRAASRWRRHGESVDRIVRRMGWRLFFGGGPEDMAHLCGKLLLAEADRLPGGEERGTRSVIKVLALSAMTAAQLCKTDATIRFFRRTTKQKDHLISRHNVKCLNGFEPPTLPRLGSSTSARSLLERAKRMAGHKEGLVFQYGERACSVLFCSDTRMSFLNKGQAIRLDRPTVVTAPRQGSVAADRAYDHIISDNPAMDYWVRAHFSNARKMSPCFKNKPNVLCLTDCHSRTLQEVLLSFDKDRWSPRAGGSCSCGQEGLKR